MTEPAYPVKKKDPTMAERRPTVRDVARAAGVSAMSVSRVLNGQPGVGPETARRIEEVVKALGFRPNKLATTLRRRRGMSLLGMVVPYPYTPLFTALTVEVDELVRDEGLIVVTGSSDRDVDQERALVGAFIERGFDGILLFSEDADHRYLKPELDSGRPVVFLGSPPVGVEASTVLVDNRGGTRDAVEHLLRHGHRRIGIVTSVDMFPAAERLAGYKETLVREGVGDDPSLIRIGPITPEFGQEAARSLLEQDDPATAIFSTNYLLTRGVLGAIRSHGRPVALIAFDDFEAASLVDPPITVVTQDLPAMGRHAAEMLLSQLTGVGERERPARVVVPAHLVPRGSGELPPAS